MKNRIVLFSKLFAVLFFILGASAPLRADNGIMLYTPYTSVSVPPGETVEYSVDVRNSGTVVRNVDVFVAGLKQGWETTLKAGGYKIRQISVLPGETKTMKLTVNVPMKVDKGGHWFRVVARGFATLPLMVDVSEQGTYKTTFTSDQMNIEGHSGANFSFRTELKNSTGEAQAYSLLSSAPRGWKVVFKPKYKQATAVEVAANATTNITVDIEPPYNVKSGTYQIPVRAVNKGSSAELNLEVVISGNFDMELSTPDGRLNADITAGQKEELELVVKNTGSETLENVTMSSGKPKGWSVSFDPDTIPHIEAGKEALVKAVVATADKAIPGDYVVRMSSKTLETKSDTSFRVSVKTPLLWGWLGILIILLTLGVILYLFRKYGRR